MPPNAKDADLSHLERRSALRTIARVGPYLWPEGQGWVKRRVVLALMVLVLAKLVSVATPVFYKAAVDALTGEGLNFSELDVPFTYTDGEVQIAEAKATGTSIGFTASGTVYTHADVLNIQGTVVPAYALNSMLGKIPLLGNIFAGTEDGGGVFAANFSVTGPVEDPETKVNPLSALTPGILRNLFGAFAPEQQPHPLLAPENPPLTVR